MRSWSPAGSRVEKSPDKLDREKAFLKIEEIIWLPQFVQKIITKHHVWPEEVEEVLLSRPVHRKAKRGQVQGEDLYAAYGQTETGRYLFIVFIHKPPRRALVISARDMNESERRYYHGRRKKT
jgi:uncharacterized DUF497 family protein